MATVYMLSGYTGDTPPQLQPLHAQPVSSQLPLLARHSAEEVEPQAVEEVRVGGRPRLCESVSRVFCARHFGVLQLSSSCSFLEPKLFHL